LLDHEIKPEDIGMITWAKKHQLSESKKPFMAVYLKSKNGGNIVTDPSLQKHRRKRQKLLESSSLNFHANPFQGIIYILFVYLYVINYYIYSFSNNKCISDFTSLYEVRSCQVQTLYVSFRDLEWQVKFINLLEHGGYPLYLFLKTNNKY